MDFSYLSSDSSSLFSASGTSSPVASGGTSSVAASPPLAGAGVVLRGWPGDVVVVSMWSLYFYLMCSTDSTDEREITVPSAVRMYWHI